MVGNPNKENYLARNFINERVDLILKGVDCDYKLFIKEVLLKFAVTQGSIEIFLKDFYIDIGIIKVDESTGLITKVEVQDERRAL